MDKPFDIAKSLDTPSPSDRRTVWTNKTSEGARKAWETRRAAGEGGAEKPEEKPAPKAEAKPKASSDHPVNPAHIKGVKGGRAEMTAKGARAALERHGFKQVKHDQSNQGDWSNNAHHYEHEDGRRVTVHMDYGPTRADNRMHVEVHPPKEGFPLKSIEDLITQHTEKTDSDEVQACVRRKIPIIAEDHPEMENDQRVAVAFSMCRKDPTIA